MYAFCKCRFSVGVGMNSNPYKGPRRRLGLKGGEISLKDFGGPAFDSEVRGGFQGKEGAD